MFSEQYGLQQAVLEGRKTMTRRAIPAKYTPYLDAISKGVLIVDESRIPSIEEFAKQWSSECGRIMVMSGHEEPEQRIVRGVDFFIEKCANYKKGEVVAIAQRYSDIPMKKLMSLRTSGKTDRWPFESLLRGSKGWKNKMYVIASLMPNRIRITNIRVERIQDISDEDCLREGIRKMTFDTFSFDSWKFFTHNPREAFAALIAKVSGKGIWKRNPWVFVYEFELVK